jgi:hypothetical protein
VARDDDILDRLDRHIAHSNEHMARGNELMARSNEHMARGNELMAEVRKEHRLNRMAYERGTRLIIGLVERQGRAFGEVVRENTAVIREMREEMRLVRGRLEAQTEAIFRVLDRLDGGNGPAAA